MSIHAYLFYNALHFDDLPILHDDHDEMVVVMMNQKNAPK